MAIDPARHQAQLRAVRGDEPARDTRKRPPSRACEAGCGKRTRDPSGTCPRCQVIEEATVVGNLSIEQLHQIIAAARTELERRAGAINEALRKP